jgi:hypothetical protein
MDHKDSLLNAKLEALQQGVQPDQIITDLQPDSSDLIALIQLSAAVQAIQHPSIAPERTQVLRQRYIQSARRLHGKSRTSARTEQANPTRTWMPRLQMLGAIAIVTLAVVIIGLLSWQPWASEITTVSAATLENIVGRVEIAEDPAGQAWQAARISVPLTSGVHLRTLGSESSAAIVFQDGSRSTLQADTEIRLDRVSQTTDGLRVALSQVSGLSNHLITPASNGFFIVYTPSSAASVRGTDFSVQVSPDGAATVNVQKGIVLVSGDLNDLFLSSGQSVTTHPGQEISGPASPFNLQGVLDSVLGETLFVAGIPIQIKPVVQGELALQPGDFLNLNGYIQSDSTWQTSNLEKIPAANAQLTFNGQLESANGEIWLVSGFSVFVPEEAVLDEGLTAGDTVRVNALLDGEDRWSAQRIQRLQPVPDEIPPDPEAKPNLFFSPDELFSAGCQDNFILTGNLFNAGNEPMDVAANVVIVASILRGAAYIDSIVLTPNTWESIPAGGQVEFLIQLNLDPDTWGGAPEDSEVKIRLFIAQETNRPDHHKTRLTITVGRDCQPNPTLSATPTPPQAFITPTTPVNSPSDIYCTGAQPHPTGQTLAERYGVSYDVIMGWFCQGYGFGEIDLVYSLSQESGIPVEQIFAMRESGMGWGTIKQQLQVEKDRNNNKDNNKEHNKDNNEDNNKDKDK